MKDRLIAVGDIHGQLDLLCDLLAQIAPVETDQLVFLGDYCDRGPDSPGVLDELLALRRQFPHTVFLRGNHEQMLLDARDDALDSSQEQDICAPVTVSMDIPISVQYFLDCGGLQTLQAYADNAYGFNPLCVLADLPHEHINFLQATRLYYQARGFYFVHASVDPADPTGEDAGQRIMLWEREPLWLDDSSWDKVVVHGHTPVPEPIIAGLEVALDTGAGHDGRLSACDLLSQRIWQAG